MSAWDCELVAQDEDPLQVVAPTVVVQGLDSGPLGTFSVSDDDVVKITYNPKTLSDPESYIATVAHELAHYLMLHADELPPGGIENHEYATDALAVVMGFGVFLSNTAFQFSQYTSVDSQGWSTQTQGYLSQYELVYCLAIFAALKNIPKSSVLQHLKPSLRGFYRKCEKELTRRYHDRLDVFQAATTR